MSSDQEVQELADRLQARGPDEYPRGYYEHLAREQLSKEEHDRYADHRGPR